VSLRTEVSPRAVRALSHRSLQVLTVAAAGSLAGALLGRATTAPVSRARAESAAAISLARASLMFAGSGISGRLPSLSVTRAISPFEVRTIVPVGRRGIPIPLWRARSPVKVPA
jgi:hypothetical protein